jgi:DeoR family suf operon transcriptional repressor
MTASPLSPRSVAELPPGQKGPRGSILVQLKAERGLCARELGERLGLSLNAMRHHLKELEVAGLIEYEREVRGVGAPAFCYHLTRQGEALFPNRLEGLLDQLLDHVVAREGRAAASAVLEQFFLELGHRFEEQVAGASPAERRVVVTRLLSEEGFMPEWRVAADGAETILLHNCPIRVVADRLPEVCEAETRFLTKVFGVTLERLEHREAGAGACEYRLPTEERAG